LAAAWENAPRASNGVDASAKMRDLREIIVKLLAGRPPLNRGRR
jgi:hypothetical protein